MQVMDLKANPIEQFPDRIESEESHVSGVQQPLLHIREVSIKQTQSDTSVRNVWQCSDQVTGRGKMALELLKNSLGVPHMLENVTTEDHVELFGQLHVQVQVLDVPDDHLSTE